MKKQTILPPQDPTETLLLDLIADCQAIIRDHVVPSIATTEPHLRGGCIHSVTNLMDSAVKLSDAVTRVRGAVPVPEMRQRITVERIEPVQRLSPPRGRGDEPKAQNE
jgi:hypothetical protein